MIETLSPRAPSGGRAEVIQTELKLEDETFLTDDFLRQLINVGEDRAMALPNWSRAFPSMMCAPPPICTRSAPCTQ